MKISQLIKYLRNLGRKVNGSAEYEEYLKHFKQHHKGQKTLTKKEFFAKKEQEKWGKINRCC